MVNKLLNSEKKPLKRMRLICHDVERFPTYVKEKRKSQGILCTAYV